MDYTEKNKNFIAKFNFNKYGFYEPLAFIDCIGFSVKKKFKNDDENITLLKFYIFDNDINIKKKPIYIHATYGINTSDGVIIRSMVNFKNPIDAEYRNEYFYDITAEAIYKKNKKISADDLINDVYNAHIKITKPIKGFFLRIKLRFWRIILKAFFGAISKLFYFVLRIISGDKYTYEYALRQETFNGQIIQSAIKYRFADTEKNIKKENLEKSEKIDFFGLKVRYWPIAFYAILHLCLYCYVVVYTNYRPINIKRIFENNFLIVLYVILSFLVLEKFMPHLLKLAIKNFAILSAKCLYKKIKL